MHLKGSIAHLWKSLVDTNRLGHYFVLFLCLGTPMQKLESQESAHSILKIAQLQKAFENMHKSVTGLVSKSKARNIRFHNKKTNIQEVNYEVGGYVLVRRSKNDGHKISFIWSGPKRITHAKSSLVYEVENIVDGKR